jgi:hypothetical protein
MKKTNHTASAAASQPIHARVTLRKRIREDRGKSEGRMRAERVGKDLTPFTNYISSL